MPLRAAKGNMYGFVTHTWNTISGPCGYDCRYCYMKKWNLKGDPHFNEPEMKTDLGVNNFVFVGSSIDIFHPDIPVEWIEQTLNHCKKHSENTYLFQTKNPDMYYLYAYRFPPKTILCITLETDNYYDPEISKAPAPLDRFKSFLDFREWYADRFRYMVTVEPIMDFNPDKFFNMLDLLEPEQINIGANSGGYNLTEPDQEKLKTLLDALGNYGYDVHKKSNLERLLI